MLVSGTAVDVSSSKRWHMASESTFFPSTLEFSFWRKCTSDWFLKVKFLIARGNESFEPSYKTFLCVAAQCASRFLTGYHTIEYGVIKMALIFALLLAHLQQFRIWQHELSTYIQWCVAFEGFLFKLMLNVRTLYCSSSSVLVIESFGVPNFAENVSTSVLWQFFLLKTFQHPVYGSPFESGSKL